MLVLGRKVGERIVIGKDICITVTMIRGDLVRIGIEAPRQVTILREELVPGEPGDLGPR
jgi:carbon storage regulator